MVKKGKPGRLKRKPAPRFWPLHRKEYLWVVRPSSGPHSIEHCLPLSIVLRDILQIAKTRKESKKIISQGKIYIDGKVRRKDDFPVGLMDIISMPDSKLFFRVMPSHKGLFLDPINKKETAFKLCKVESKATVESGNIQVALHDGSNILLKADISEAQQGANYETFDILKLSLPEKQVITQLKTKEGNLAIITGGKNIGKQGRIVEIEKTTAKKRRNALVVIGDEKGNRYQTILDFVFSIGATKPLISSLEATKAV